MILFSKKTISVACMLLIASVNSSAMPVFESTPNSESLIGGETFDGGSYFIRSSVTAGDRFVGQVEAKSSYSFTPSAEHATAEARALKYPAERSVGESSNSGAGVSNAYTLVTYNVVTQALSDFQVDYVPIFADWTTVVSRTSDLNTSRLITSAYVSMNDGNRSFNYTAVSSGVSSGTEAFLLSDRGLNVTLEANVSLRTSDNAFASSGTLGYAYADPSIYIDPSWEHADLFALDFRASYINDAEYTLGVERTGAISVSEPSPILLFSVGLLFLSIQRRVRFDKASFDG